MRKREIEDNRVMVMEDEFVIRMRNLGGRLGILICVGTLVCMVAVVVAGVVFFGLLSLLVMEMECLEVGFGLVGDDILNLGRDFVALVVEVDVEDIELEVKAIVRLIWGCSRVSGGEYLSCGI